MQPNHCLTKIVGTLANGINVHVCDRCGRTIRLRETVCRAICRIQPEGYVRTPVVTPTPVYKLTDLPCLFRRERAGTVPANCCDGTRQIPVYVCVKFKICTINAIGTTDAQKIGGILPAVCNGCPAITS